MRDRQEAVALNMLVERVTAKAAAGLFENGVQTLVLKGPVRTRLLYGDESHRISTDVDLLIPEHGLEATTMAMRRLGYAPRQLGILPGDRPHHATTWEAAGEVPIDVHVSLVGANASRSEVWRLLSARSVVERVAGVPVRVPDVAAHAVITVLHAAQHGADHAVTLRDLHQALVVLTDDDWRQAADLAKALQAEAAFSTGISLVPRGAELARRLGLSDERDTVTTLRAASAPGPAWSLDWFHHLAATAKIRFVAAKLVPPPPFMKSWRPIARKGPAGLAVAYAWRPLWILAQLPTAYVMLRRARRAVEKSSRR